MTVVKRIAKSALQFHLVPVSKSDILLMQISWSYYWSNWIDNLNLRYSVSVAWCCISSGGSPVWIFQGCKPLRRDIRNSIGTKPFLWKPSAFSIKLLLVSRKNSISYANFGLRLMPAIKISFLFFLGFLNIFRCII